VKNNIVTSCIAGLSIPMHGAGQPTWRLPNSMLKNDSRSGYVLVLEGFSKENIKTAETAKWIQGFWRRWRLKARLFEPVQKLDVLKGHGFSRARGAAEEDAALAAE
jgi:hypothetical protein